ncbi:MAG: hypothetical protein PUD05_04065 [Lachnospiraceae bacterium]|nr:hypothetical protein [Lachnospiraceae bacterium]MDY2944799.1 hypothetical protein [Lachnospiraceae bacterium]MDY5113274.1 hypothetical protein [Bilifractor sp.]
MISKNEKHAYKLNKSGLTLAETLLCVLLLTIILVPVAGGAVNLIGIYKQIRLKTNARTLLSTSVQAVSEDLYYSDPGRTSGDGWYYSEKLYYSSDSPDKVTASPSYVQYFNDENSNVISIRCKSVYSDSDTGTSTALLSDASQPLDLYATFADDGAVTWNSDGYYTFTINIINKQDHSVVESRTAVVRPALYAGVAESEKAGK